MQVYIFRQERKLIKLKSYVTMRKRTSDRADIAAVAGIYRKTDLLEKYCVVLYWKSSGCSNVRKLPVLYYPMQAHSQGAKEGAMDPLHIRMHPLGLYEISKKNLSPNRQIIIIITIIIIVIIIIIIIMIIIIFAVALRTNAGHGLLILEVSRSHTMTDHSR